MPTRIASAVLVLALCAGFAHGTQYSSSGRAAGAADKRRTPGSAAGVTWVDVDDGIAASALPASIGPDGAIGTAKPATIEPVFPGSPPMLGTHDLDYVYIDPGRHGANLWPWYPLYSGFRFQMLYMASEIGRSGTICQMAFFKDYYSYEGTFPNVSFKLCHTSLSDLNTDFNSNYDGNTPVWVYHGANLHRGNGAGAWDTVDFQTKFNYNGTDNLLVEITWVGSASGNYPASWYTNTSNYRRVYASNIIDTLVADGSRDYEMYNTRIGFCGAPNDVGVTQIISPLGPFYCFGDTIWPRAEVTNYGEAQTDVPVRCIIEDKTTGTEVYNEVVNVDLDVGQTDTVYFPCPYVPPPVEAVYVDTMRTELAGDGDPSNDAKANEITICGDCLDAAAVSIDAPDGTVCGYGDYVPVATVKNNGLRPRSFDVAYVIVDALNPGDTVYADTVTTPKLAPGEEYQVTFDPWQPSRGGAFELSCTTMLPYDADHSNDAQTGSVKVLLWPDGWVEMASVPLGPQKRGIKDGAWLAARPWDDYVHAIKGDRTDEFYRYDIDGDVWQQLAPIPEGRERKLPFFGARGVRDDSIYIYATKGHETPGFWRYDIVHDAWAQLADVPEKPNGNTKVGAGTDVTYVPYDPTWCNPQRDSGRGYVYLLKANSGEFYRYNITTGIWEERRHAPPQSGNTLWKAGSYITFDGEQTIHAHRSFDRPKGGVGNEMWTFDLVTQEWSQSALPGIPGTPPTASQDGGCGDWSDGSIWALKGGDTREFWRYTPPGDWLELDPMPKQGCNKQPRNVFWGGDIISHACRAFFAFKGHDTPEFWRYVYAPEGSGGGQASAVGRDGDVGMKLTLSPSPLVGDIIHVRYSLDQAGPASIALYDISGREVARGSYVGAIAEQFSLDLHFLSAGVYIMRLDDGAESVTQKLVVQR